MVDINSESSPVCPASLDVSYVLNGFIWSYLPYFLVHFWKSKLIILIISVDDNNMWLVELIEADCDNTIELANWILRWL